MTGEPGIGKTRLVEEFAARCAHRGALVAQARSYRSEGLLGYGVVVAWLRTTEVAVQLRRADQSDFSELASFLPELGDAPAPARSDMLDPESRRRRLFDAVSRTLVATGRPTLLIADDAQWCDAPSLQLLHYLVRIDPTRPLLVVGTVRREDLDDAHPLGEVAAGLQVIDRIAELRLGRLTPADTVDWPGGSWAPTSTRTRSTRSTPRPKATPCSSWRWSAPDGTVPEPPSGS